MRFVVSACLAGFRCRYDGKDQTLPEVERLFQQGLALPVCPELLGGLTVPRSPCECLSSLDRQLFSESVSDGVFFSEIAGLKLYQSNFHLPVMTKEGQNVTNEFLSGAFKAFLLARNSGCTQAILKARSPSCGIGRVYDGTFSKRLIPGDGCFASLLRAASFTLYTEEDLAALNY